jgi:arabinose-5-phosphate isomerase
VEVFDLIRAVINTEAEAVSRLTAQVDAQYAVAVECMLNCEGKVIVTGVGKSGIIGRKIAASLSSTGTPAYFLHACEAVHGDSGTVEKEDVVILISNSGETSEVLNLLPILEEIGCQTIAITSGRDSTLARLCDIALVYGYEREADHLNLAPTTSAALTLVIGDALAVALSILKGFDQASFYLYHPGGSLGEKLGSLVQKKSSETGDVSGELEDQ